MASAEQLYWITDWYKTKKIPDDIKALRHYEISFAVVISQLTVGKQSLPQQQVVYSNDGSFDLPLPAKCWFECIQPGDFRQLWWRVIFAKQCNNFLSNFQSNVFTPYNLNCLLWNKRLVRVGLINTSCLVHIS